MGISARSLHELVRSPVQSFLGLMQSTIGSKLDLGQQKFIVKKCRAFPTVLKLVAARGFKPEGVLPPEEEIWKTLEKEHTLTCCHTSDPLRRMRVLFIADFKFTIGGARLIEPPPADGGESVHEFEATIVVSFVGPTPSARKFVSNRVQFFTADELSKNIVEHVMVPIHRPLSDKEVAIFLKQRLVTKAQLPKLLSTDPICKYYKWPVGTIVKSAIVYGGTQEPRNTYRVVI